jgi:hypothetical protein
MELDGEDLACLGFRRADPPSFFAEIAAALQADRFPTRPAVRTRRTHKPTLASVARDARKAGIEVARYEVKSDGTVVIVTGQPVPAEPENPWLADLRKDTKQ